MAGTPPSCSSLADDAQRTLSESRNIDMQLTTLRVWALTLFVCLVAGATSAAQEEEFDNSKSKLQLNCWVSAPSGYFNGKDGQGYFDLQRDLASAITRPSVANGTGVSSESTICSLL